MHTTQVGPGALDTVSLAVELAEELGVRAARDTHLAWLDRVHGVLRRPTGGVSELPGAVHRTIARSVYAGIGTGLRGTSRGLAVAADVAADLGLDERWGTGLGHTGPGRFAHSAVNGLIGDRVTSTRPRFAIPMAVRAGGRDVPLDAAGLERAFPAATGRLVVFVHGLCENEDYWSHRREERGGTYAEGLAERGWTPVMLRVDTGAGVRPNGAALAALMQRLVEAWPVGVERICLVGHSMGGLVIRAASAVVTEAEEPWGERVTDVVTLGTPHLGAPLAKGVGDGARVLALAPELAAFGRILDLRSAGVRDLVEGLAEDVAPLPHARYHPVAATLTASPRNPVSTFLGDMLVRLPSASGRLGELVELFPGAEVLHVPRADHFDLLNHPRVHRALLDWLT